MLKLLDKLPKWFGHIYTMFLVLISWVIFAFEDLSQVGSYLSSMFGLNGIAFENSETLYYISNYIIIIIIGVICSIPIRSKKRKKEINKDKIYKNQVPIAIISSIGYVVIVIISTASLVNNSFNPFLYFRF